jgi:hypothetical protein
LAFTITGSFVPIFVKAPIINNMFPLALHNYFEILALITSVVCWPRIKSTNLRWFLPYLSFIVIIEFTGRYIRTVIHKTNTWLYLISIPMEYIFFAIIFYLHFRNKSYKLIAGYFVPLFSIFVVVNILLYQKASAIGIILLTGSFSMMMFSCLYLIDIFRRNEIINLLKYSLFWITIGVLLFNAGEFMYDLFFKTLRLNKLDRTAKLFSDINNKLILVLYTCISIGLIWTKKETYRKTFDQ